MVRTQRLLTIIIAIMTLALAGSAFAKAHHHKNGEQMVGAHIKTNGQHTIDKHGKHTVSAQVTNGKIAGISVKHSEKGDVPVKKYKTKKKMAQADGVTIAETDGIRPVAYIQVQAYDLGTTYIGYSFVDDNGDEVIYWFPFEMILDGDTGAVDYVPVA
jgi:hypothetical protein